MSDPIIFSLIIYFILGAIAGLLSGTLGIGGGIIIVPGLAWLFQFKHFPSQSIMQMAAATSLATVLVSMLQALWSHRHRHQQAEFWSVYRIWAIPLILGVIAGTTSAHFLNSKVLGVCFGVFMLLIATKILISAKETTKTKLPGNLGMIIIGFLIGAISGLLGISGGILAMPFLLHCNVDMRRTVIISIALALTVTIVGTISVMFTGWHQSGLPSYTIGYIYWPAWIGLVIGCLIFVPVGVFLSYRLPVITLRKALAAILLLVGIHMLISI